jgi:hypothetical protein
MESDMVRTQVRRRREYAAVRAVGLAGLFAAVGAVTAAAQSPPVLDPPPGVPKNANPPSESTTPPPVPGADPAPPDRPPLSQQLKENDGVLEAPKSLDGEIVREAPVPNPGTTPVIPPPGSPGGDPSVKPK